MWFVYHDGKLYRRRVHAHHFKTKRACNIYNKRYATKLAGTLDTSNGYLKCSLRGISYYVHRIIWELHHGEIPSGLQIDHKDRNPTNNRIENLRLVTPSENVLNTADRPSKFGRGIKRTASGSFGARVGDKWLGSFKTLQEARKAREEALVGD